MRKKVLPLLLTLCMLVLLIPTTVFAEPQTEVKTVGGQIEAFGMTNGEWISLGKLTFPKSVETQTIEITENITSLKIVKLSGYEVNLDELTLEGVCPTGYERKLSATDKDLIEVIDETVFDLSGSGTLTISARAPLTLLGEEYAFKFPETNLYRPVTADSDFYTYTIGTNNATFSTCDTVSVPDSSNLFYNEMVYPGTGHPAAPMQICLADDGVNLYAFFEVFLDNTFDHGKDHAAVHIKDGDTVKTYAVYTTDTNEYGKWYFDYTDTDPSLNWQHMSYVIEIPLSDFSSPASDLSIAFEYYGTAGTSTLESLALDGKYFLSGTTSEGKIPLPTNGVYYNSEGGNTPTGEWWLYCDETNAEVPYTLTLNNATLDEGSQDIGWGLESTGLYINGNLNIVLTDGSINTIADTENNSLVTGIYSNGYILNISGNASLNIESNYEDQDENNFIPFYSRYSVLKIKDSTVNASGTAKYGMQARVLNLVNAELNIGGENIADDGLLLHNYGSANPSNLSMDNSLLTISSGSHAINRTDINTFPTISNATIHTGSNATDAVLVPSLTNLNVNTPPTSFQTAAYLKIDNRIYNAVTVTGGGTGATVTGNYQKGKKVSLNAGEKTGYTFKGWTSDDVTITNASSKSASFVMPKNAVTVTANWEVQSGGEGQDKAPKSTAYEITKNDNYSYKCNGDYDKFVGLTIDGKDVAKINYTVERGSTIVTLSQEYLKTLSSGEHTMTFIYTDGSVETKFTIEAIANTGVKDYANLAVFGIFTSIAGYATVRCKANGRKENEIN